MTNDPATTVEQLQRQILAALRRGADAELRELQDRYRRLGVAETRYLNADGQVERIEYGDPTIEMWRNGPVIGSAQIASTEN